MNKYIVRLPNEQYATLETKEDLMPNRIVDITVDGENVRAVVLQKGYRSLLRDPFVIVDGQIRALPLDEFDEPHMEQQRFHDGFNPGWREGNRCASGNEKCTLCGNQFHKHIGTRHYCPIQK